MPEDIDKEKRAFLVKATTFVGAAGCLAATTPFIASWLPGKEEVIALEPVEVDIGSLQPGKLMTVDWQGKPVWVLRRTKQMLAELDRHNDKLSDPLSKVNQQPKFAVNKYRSLKPEFLVLIGICTHLGCIPHYQPSSKGKSHHNEDGGFFCPCHGSKFDLSGRVYKGVPAPINLAVPPHYFASNSKLIIGVNDPKNS